MLLGKKRILIVDDDKDICTILAGALEDYYECEWICDGGKALAHIETCLPHLVLLDYQLPVLHGIEICTRLKAHRALRHIPVIFISGVATVEEKVRAFECGASDFIQKPFDLREFLLRIQARLMPPSGRASKVFVAGNLRLDALSRRAFVNSQEILLTQRQFDILKVLMARKNKLVTRIECTRLVWGQNDVATRKIDSHISMLKSKLQGFQGKIISIQGVGYSLTV